LFDKRLDKLSKEMKWAGSVARMADRGASESVLLGKSERFRVENLGVDISTLLKYNFK
jgi:hypothetical protein